MKQENLEFFNATKTREESAIYWLLTGGEKKDMDFKALSFYRALLIALMIIMWYAVLVIFRENASLTIFFLFLGLVTVHWGWVQFEIAQGVIALALLSVISFSTLSWWYVERTFGLS